jgi:hypothetical protein
MTISLWPWRLGLRAALPSVLRANDMPKAAAQSESGLQR